MAFDPTSITKGPLQLGQSIVQMFKANNSKNAADSAAPPLVDPNQASFLSELNQKRASLDSGTAYAAGLNNINATNAGTNQGLVQAGAGNTGGTIQALLQSQRVSQDSANQLNAQGQQEQNFNNTMYGELLNKVAARKWQLQNQASQQKRAEWATSQQSANQNASAGLANMGNPVSDLLNKNTTSTGGAPTNTSSSSSTTSADTGAIGDEAAGGADALTGGFGAGAAEGAGAAAGAGGMADLALLAI